MYNTPKNYANGGRFVFCCVQILFVHLPQASIINLEAYRYINRMQIID